MTALPSVDVTIYPFQCDAFGHLNHATLLAVLERARWDSLARGPGMDLFHRNGVAPVVRKVTVDYRVAAFPGDVLRIDTLLVHRGTTSWTLRHVATRIRDGAAIAEAEVVFVLVDRAGRPTPPPEEVSRALGMPRASGTERMRIAVGDGAELAVEVRGEGPAVLFVHGFPLDHGVWRPQLAALARWRRIAPDLRGVGESSARGPYSIAQYADDLVAVLDAVGAREAVVCGLSMGGYITFELLRRYPERVRAVVLAGTRAAGDSAEIRAGRDANARRARSEGVEAVGEEMLPRLLGATTRREQPDVVEQFRRMVARVSVEGMVGALEAMRDRVDSTPLLGSLRVPTLVLVGAEDQATPPEGARALAAAIPGARLSVVPAAGHLAPLEQPLAATRAVAEFLDTLG